jgi:hypothetical protein
MRGGKVKTGYERNESPYSQDRYGKDSPYSQEINGKDIPNCMEERTLTGEEKSR